MATGSGKTLMMAGLILYLYEKGYRNFLFFVNSTNIIDKTRDNFLNDTSINYLLNKYAPRLIFDYPLKQFRIDGYSKEVKVLQTDAEPFYRALQAVLLSQYRRKIFEKNKKVIKPVILLKSKTINDSQKFQEEFIR